MGQSHTHGNPFLEENEGRKQELLFRILTKHHTALERQIMESVVFKEVAENKEACLNLKSKWKLPVKVVTKPEGTSNKG